MSGNNFILLSILQSFPCMLARDYSEFRAMVAYHIKKRLRNNLPDSGGTYSHYTGCGLSKCPKL